MKDIIGKSIIVMASLLICIAIAAIITVAGARIFEWLVLNHPPSHVKDTTENPLLDFYYTDVAGVMEFDDGTIVYVHEQEPGFTFGGTFEIKGPGVSCYGGRFNNIRIDDWRMTCQCENEHWVKCVME